MRRLWAICAGFLIVCLVSGVAAATEEGKADSASSPGLVYGYGVKLSRPYEFTKSEDGKTLYLNGLIYDGPGDKEPPAVAVTEEIRAMHELNVKALEESRDCATEDDRLARMAAVYRSSPLVESARHDSHRVYVKWVAYPHEMGFILMEPPEDEIPDFDREVFWENLQNSFWRTIDSGGMVAFGRKYHISIPPNLLSKTLEQIEHIRSGAPHESLDTRDTPLIEQHFLEDLYRESENAEAE